jgi:hypothetical protein
MIHLGFRASGVDARDWPLGKLGAEPRATLPDAVSYEAQLSDIFEQAGPSCVGEALARAWHERAVIQGSASPIYPDPLALYALARAAERGDPALPLIDSGAMPRWALSALSDCGALPRGSWYDPSRTLRPDWATLRSSADRRGVQYARLWSPVEARQALAAGFPVVIGGDVDQSYLDQSTGIWGGVRGAVLGGHARCLVGYRPGSFREVNSWGETWGEHGLCWLADSVLDVSELWAVELVQT